MILQEFNLSTEQSKKFERYFQFLVAENNKYNLTAITKKNEVYIKHFYDSLIASQIVEFEKITSYCDIGSGGGFPAIPLKILFPHLKTTLIEPIKKKSSFLVSLCEYLNIDDIEIINQRAEDFINKRREYYDLVSSRAVAILPILLELSIPFLKVGGINLAYKGINFQEDLEDSKKALSNLSAEVINIYKYNLPQNMGNRVIIRIQKQAKTDEKYPRRYNKIKKNHL